MSPLVRFALISASIFVLFAWSQPYPGQPVATHTPVDPQSLSAAAVGQIPGTAAGIAAQAATATPYVSVTPSPLPVSVLEWRQTSIRNTFVSIVILIMVLGIVLWIAFRRARVVSAGNVLEAGVGFLGWFAINTLLWVWVLNNKQSVVFWDFSRLVPCCVNLPVLLVLGIWRRWTILGILAAILVNSVGTLLFGTPGPYVDDRFSDIIGMIPFYMPFFFPAL